jgi:hypothetical protein
MILVNYFMEITLFEINFPQRVGILDKRQGVAK